MTTSERMEVQRTIPANPATIFRLLCDPQGHVAIDSSGMLLDATGEPVTAVGDTFVVHMDREALNDFPMGRYDVTRHHQDAHPGPRDRLDDPRSGQTADRTRLRLHARARRGRHARDLLLRLVEHRSGLERGRHLPDPVRGCAPGDPRHPGPDGGSGWGQPVGLIGAGRPVVGLSQCKATAKEASSVGRPIDRC